MKKFIFIMLASIGLANTALAQMTIITDIVIVCDFEAIGGTFTNCVTLDSPAFFTIDGQNGWVKYTTGGKTNFFFIKSTTYNSDAALTVFDTMTSKGERFIVSVGIVSDIVAVMGTDRRGTYLMTHHITDSW